MIKYHWNEVDKRIEDQVGRVIFVMHTIDKIQGEAVAGILNGGKTTKETESDANERIKQSDEQCQYDLEKAQEDLQETQAQLDKLTEKHTDLITESCKVIKDLLVYVESHGE